MLSAEDVIEILYGQRSDKEEVLERLATSKEDKSPGPSAMHPTLLKEINEDIVENMPIIFQASVD